MTAYRSDHGRPSFGPSGVPKPWCIVDKHGHSFRDSSGKVMRWYTREAVLQWMEQNNITPLATQRS
jgi:hypothetical protein